MLSIRFLYGTFGYLYFTEYALFKLQMEDDSIHNMSHARGLPGLPPLPQASEEPSELYQVRR